MAREPAMVFRTDNTDISLTLCNLNLIFVAVSVFSVLTVLVGKDALTVKELIHFWCI